MFPYSIPFSQPKNQGFNFFPAGTIKQYDARKWALYYVPSLNMSFIVIDFPDRWKINHYVGMMQLRYVQDVMASKPCCNEQEV